MFGCFFGHDWAYLGDFIPVEYGKYGFSRVYCMIPAVCKRKRCHQVDLVQPPWYDFTVSYRPWETMTPEQALEIARKRLEYIAVVINETATGVV